MSCLITAIDKALNGTLDSSTLTNSMTSALLLICSCHVLFERSLDLGRNKKRIVQLWWWWSLHSLATISGAVTLILDEVSDQKTMDALLAYAVALKHKQHQM